jgi:tetratricopeptide (TPR) repeat protein
MPLTFLSGIILPVLGQNERARKEGAEALQLNPSFPVSYDVLTFSYIALNRFDEAKATYRQAVERKFDSASFLHIAPYQIAFLQNDAAEMAKQVALSVGKSPAEDELLALEADTAAYSGRLREAAEYSRRAIDSAERAEEKEVAALCFALHGLREALFGNAEEARRRANLATARSAQRDVHYGAALALAYAGDDKGARTLTDELSKRFPEDTMAQFNYLPTLHAKSACPRPGECF